MTHRSTFPRAVAIAALLAAPAGAQTCPDTRLFGHLRYADAPEETLASVPADDSVRRGCRLRAAVLPDLTTMLAAARSDPRTGGRLLALSCFRSSARQTAVFGREQAPDGADERAISVAPPGYSEHATGYALDFAVRPANGCPDVEACMAASPQARWLLANAPRYGFELSFPGGNRQQVKWEPWHWRWVGRTGDAPDAAAARAVFACARAWFPASPAVGAVVVRVVTQPPVPVVQPVPVVVPPPTAKIRRQDLSTFSPLRHPGHVPGSTGTLSTSLDPRSDDLAARWTPEQVRGDEGGSTARR